MIISVFGGVENIVGKGENAGYQFCWFQAFSPFPTMFCSERAISPFPIVFSTHLENFMPFSSNLKSLSANTYNFKICGFPNDKF